MKTDILKGERNRIIYMLREEERAKAFVEVIEMCEKMKMIQLKSGIFTNGKDYYEQGSFRPLGFNEALSSIQSELNKKLK